MPIRKYKRQVNKNPKIHGKQSQWSDKQKMEACSTYLLTGSWVVTAQATKIPLDTIKKWGASQWWKEAEEEIRRSSRIETQGKLKKIIDKSLLHLEDRLDNGDFVYDSKTGKISRRPVQARTLSTIVKEGIDKSVLLEKLQTAPQQSMDQIGSRLAKIQEEFKRFAKAKTIEGELTNHAVVPGVQERLSTREQVQVVTEANQTSGDA